MKNNWVILKSKIFQLETTVPQCYRYNLQPAEYTKNGRIQQSNDNSYFWNVTSNSKAL
jgi:hypothetical protein